MGGKKKTKWRKLPLEEFTTSKECSSTEKKAPIDDYKLDILTEGETQNQMPSYDDSTLSDMNYPYNNEYREYSDGAVYTSPYVIYNPVYPNYIMPEDPRYYYYLPPEMNPIQEYTPMPYQDYVPPAKDTVYLLFPAPPVRSHQGVPHASYEWRNRRRRRRYEGYAEYAVIDKNNSSGFEDKDQKKKPVLSGQNDNHYNNGKTTATTETNSFTRDTLKKFPEAYKKNSDEKRSGKRNMAKLGEEKNEDFTENTTNSWKNNELCKVHTTKTSDSNLFKHQASSGMPLNTPEEDSEKIRMHPEKNDPLNSKSNVTNTNNSQELIKSDKYISNEQPEIGKNLVDLKKDKEKTLNNINEFAEVELNANSDRSKNTREESHKSDAEENVTSYFEPLPDILNTIQNSSSTNKKIVRSETSLKRNEATDDKESLDGEKRIKSILSQSPYLHRSLDSFSNETEAELKKLRTLQSLKTDQSIYQLAFDENITDQSNSRSPSPIDPESQVPRSLPNSEILIHEADSNSEAGSEDVELISHRYESESSLNENKHMYVNKLSLAVELLRTQENLPYDDEFKRVVGENALKQAQQDRTGEVNFGFVEDSYSMDDFDNSMVVTTQSEASRHFRNGKQFSEQSESCEVAKEVVVETVNPVSREGVENRRFQVPFRHYFSPRAILVNPCSCCIIM